MTTVIRTDPYRAATRRVLGWCAWYTRNLDPAVAAARRDEIASDLYEEGVWAQEAGLTPRRTARSILFRAARGMPADLSWRSRVLNGSRDTNFGPASLRRTGRGLASLLVTVGLVTTGLGILALTRTSISLAGSTIPIPVVELVAVVVLTMLSSAGTVLGALPSTRLIGALVLLFPTAWMIHFSLRLLWYSSATVQLLVARLESLPMFVVLLSVGLALVPVGAALWWLPMTTARRVRNTASGTGEKHG